MAPHARLSADRWGKPWVSNWVSWQMLNHPLILSTCSAVGGMDPWTSEDSWVSEALSFHPWPNRPLGKPGVTKMACAWHMGRDFKGRQQQRQAIKVARVSHDGAGRGTRACAALSPTEAPTSPGGRGAQGCISKCISTSLCVAQLATSGSWGSRQPQTWSCAWKACCDLGESLTLSGAQLCHQGHRQARELPLRRSA